MHLSTQVLCMLFIASTLSLVLSSDPLERGWGPTIQWHTLSEAKKVAAETSKPIMVIIHKTWCGACKRLKGEFGVSKEIAELSSSFVMVNLEDDEEPTDAAYKPDGGYIPRVFFLDSAANVHAELYNTNGNPSYKYFYSDAGAVLKGMRDALKALEPHALPRVAVGADL